MGRQFCEAKLSARKTRTARFFAIRLRPSSSVRVVGRQFCFAKRSPSSALHQVYGLWGDNFAKQNCPQEKRAQRVFLCTSEKTRGRTASPCFFGGCGIRTHAPLPANGFQDRLVMTASITLRAIPLYYATRTGKSQEAGEKKATASEKTAPSDKTTPSEKATFFEHTAASENTAPSENTARRGGRGSFCRTRIFQKFGLSDIISFRKAAAFRVRFMQNNH